MQTTVLYSLTGLACAIALFCETALRAEPAGERESVELSQRRWLSFSLRALFFLMTYVAVCLAIGLNPPENQWSPYWGPFTWIWCTGLRGHPDYFEIMSCKVCGWMFLGWLALPLVALGLHLNRWSICLALIGVWIWIIIGTVGMPRSC